MNSWYVRKVRSNPFPKWTDYFIFFYSADVTYMEYSRCILSRVLEMYLFWKTPDVSLLVISGILNMSLAFKFSMLHMTFSCWHLKYFLCHSPDEIWKNSKFSCEDVQHVTIFQVLKTALKSSLLVRSGELQMYLSW